MSERSGQTAKGKEGKTKYASLNLFDTYKGKSLETQKPVVPPRHGLQSLGKVASARRMPPPANLPSLKAENKGNDPNVSLVPKDGTGWASKQEPADPKSTDALSAPQPESQQPVASQIPAPTRPRTPPASEALAPASTQAVGARSWAQASVTHGTQGDGGKGSNLPSPFSREEFPTLQAAGDQDKAGKEQGTADQWYGPGPSLRPQNVTSWRDGGGRALAPTLSGEGAAEGGTGGALVMDGAAGVPPPNAQNHGPPRNPPAGSPALPLPQPPVGPGFPQYRGIMPPFMYPPYLPFPAPYGPQGPYRYPPPGEGPAPRFSRGPGGPDGRPQGPRDAGGEVVKRPSILKQDDLKELDELDHDGDEGWAGAHEEIDYSAKLKFSDDEGDEEGEEERTESKSDSREQQRSQDAAAASHSRGSDSGGDTRRTPPSNADNGPQPPSSKPGWAEEGGSGWTGQGAPPNYQDRPHTQGAPVGPGKPAPAQHPPAGGPTPPPQPGLLVHGSQGDDEDETWRQRRKQSSSEISAAVERARRRREEEERRMEEERRAACAEKLKRLDEKQQQQQGSSSGGGGSKTPSLDGNSTAATAGSPSPSISASASSPNISQPPSPCVDPEEPPVLAVQPGPGPGPGGGDRQRASSNSSYDSSADAQQCSQPAVAQQQPTLDVPPPGESKEEPMGSPHIRAGGGGERVDPVKIENIGGGAGRQAGGPSGQGYSKYQKSLPPRFQRQQQEQLLKQQQQWQQQQQQQQQHSQASQSQLSPQPQAQQGPSPGTTPQPGPGPKQGGPLYQAGNMVRPPPLPMNFDPRWMMMPYMDPRMMQGRPPPMDYYSAGMHPSGLIGRERSDSGGSGSDPFDRQQQQQHPGHPHRGTPPMDPKLAWGPEVFPGGGENRGLTSPLRQKQGLEDDDVAKGPRSDTPPHRMRDAGLGPIQQPSSTSGTSNQTPPPVGAQVAAQGGSHHPHHYMGGRGNYSNFPDQGGRMPAHQQQQQQQQRGGDRGNQQHGFTHQDEGPRGSQQGQIWGGPHPHYDRSSRADLPAVDSNSHLHHHHGHHPQQPHFPLHPHKQENSRDRVGDAPAKKTDSSPPLHQPSLSSSCSSSSSSSSAREDGGVKAALHHHPPQREGDAAAGHSLAERAGNAGSGHAKQEKTGPAFTSSPPPAQHGGHNQPQQQHPHPKSNQRGGREHKTETQWGPRPGSSSMGGGSQHGRRANNAGGGNSSRGGDDSSNAAADHKASNQAGGSNANKRAGPIKKPVLKEIKRDGGEVDGAEKPSQGFGKDKEQDGGQSSSTKQENSQNTSAPSKDEPAQTAKPRNGGKDRSSGGGGGGGGRGPKDGDANSSGFSGSRRDRERSFDRGGNPPHHHGVPAKGNRASRGRGGEFYGRGRGYRGTYTASAGPTGASRGRMGGRSGRDYRASVGGGHNQESKGDGAGGRHGQDRSQHNPARARNRSETRSEGSEYEEIPKRRRERGSETGSESGASDLGPSDKEDNQKPKNGSENANAAPTGNASSAPPRGSQARVFTPRGVPSRRGRGGGGGGGNIYRSSGNMGGPAGGHRVGPNSVSHGGSSKSSASARKQQGPPQSSGPKDSGRGGNAGEKKDKTADGGPPQNQGTGAPQPSAPAAPPAALGSTENGGVVAQQAPTNPSSNPGGPNALPLPSNRGFPPGGFERPPRRRRHGRSQHQQDKPPRFRRLKERENAARINGGGVGVIGGGRPSSPSLNSVQDSNGAPASAPNAGNAGNANHNATLTANNNNNSSGGGGGGGHLSNANSHHHHHYNQSNAAPPHPPHPHSHGAKSPDFTNQNSDQANEEWETASESSDFTEFRDREGGGGKSFSSHHHHHLGRGGGGGGGGLVERDVAGKEPSANKRSFSSQRPGMERQNRRVNTGGAGGGGGGRGPRGPPGGGGGGPGNGGGNRGEKRGNWPSPKNRK